MAAQQHLETLGAQSLGAAPNTYAAKLLHKICFEVVHSCLIFQPSYMVSKYIIEQAVNNQSKTYYSIILCLKYFSILYTIHLLSFFRYMWLALCVVDLLQEPNEH